MNTKHIECVFCSDIIDPERVECLQDLFPDKPLTCMNCSTIEKPLVLMNYTHKTAGEIVVVPTNGDGSRNREFDRIALNAYKRQR